MVVFVISKEGQPLMPTRRFGKVRRLLKEGQAKVVCRNPFTIQLLYKTTHYTQPIEAKRNPKNTKQVRTKDGRLWCLWDKVKINGQVGFISGFTSGNYAYIQGIDGNYIRLAGKSYKQVPLRQAILKRRNNNWIERVMAA